MQIFNVLIALSNRLFAEALKRVIEDSPAFTVPVVAESGVSALRANNDAKPDIVVAEQILPDMNMAQLIREMRRLSKSTAFLFIIGTPSPELMRLLGETECVGAVPQDVGLDEFMTALCSASRGERYVSRSIIKTCKPDYDKVPAWGTLESLTQREREVLYWIANGLTNVEIARRMILSEKTVKNHVSHILDKLDMKDRTKAAALAWKEGLPLIPDDFFTK